MIEPGHIWTCVFSHTILWCHHEELNFSTASRGLAESSHHINGWRMSSFCDPLMILLGQNLNLFNTWVSNIPIRLSCTTWSGLMVRITEPKTRMPPDLIRLNIFVGPVLTWLGSGLPHKETSVKTSSWLIYLGGGEACCRNVDWVHLESIAFER